MEDSTEDFAPPQSSLPWRISRAAPSRATAEVPYTSKCPHCGTQSEGISLLRWRKSCDSDFCFEHPAGPQLVGWVEVPPKAILLPGRKRSVLAGQELEARLAAIGALSA